mgnify:CR=1 FL=1|tara:strand:- start:643 stop:2367 length:1725 start_codon:yes stop_codon:yes gene_type:complete
MQKLFEDWRKFVKEDVISLADRRKSNDKEFVFSAEELDKLNAAISTIIDAAKSSLGADGEVPILRPQDLEKIETAPPIDSEAEGELRMVAEAEEDEDLGITDFQAAKASPEQMDIRKQYYGSEGELTQRGPKAVRGLEKGLGQMSAQEFEDAGYVMRVPQNVLADFRQLVESTKEVAGLYEEARDWYHNIRGLLDRETENDRDSALLGLLIATYSPRAKFALNLAEAVFMYKAVQQDAETNPEKLRQYLETFPGAEKRDPGSFRGFTGAHKVPNFALNLVAPNLAGKKNEFGKTVHEDLYEWNSTIDTWMIDAFYPTLRKASTAKEWDGIKGKLMSNVVSYRYMARLVAQEAKKLDLLPHELQALIWVASQIRQTGEAGLGVTTQFAYNQIRDAITNVAEIKNDLRALKDLEENDWLATIISTIDVDGFEEAAQYLLGIKDEKGKIQTPGIRSITASGKKGSAFEYFPAPEKIQKPKGPKKAKAAGAPKEKVMKAYEDPKYEDLNAHYVMNSVIQMPTGKFNNLYDSVTLYLDPEFSTDKAVEHILGRFDPDAKASKDYFKENKIRVFIRKRLL